MAMSEITDYRDENFVIRKRLTVQESGSNEHGEWGSIVTGSGIVNYMIGYGAGGRQPSTRLDYATAGRHFIRTWDRQFALRTCKRLALEFVADLANVT